MTGGLRLGSATLLTAVLELGSILPSAVVPERVPPWLGGHGFTGPGLLT